MLIQNVNINLQHYTVPKLVTSTTTRTFYPVISN